MNVYENENENVSYKNFIKLTQVNLASPQVRNYYGNQIFDNSKIPYIDNYQDRGYILNEQRKYKEDLDYLISLRRRLGEDEFQRRYGNYFKEFTRRIEMMNEVIKNYIFNPMIF